MRYLTYVLVALWLVTGPAMAAREAVVGMNERVLNAINKVQELIDAEDYGKALEELADLQERHLSPYETAHVLNLEGFVHYQLDDIRQARRSYEQALAQDPLPDSMIANLHVTLGRLALLQQDYGLAIAHLKPLLAMDDQDLPINRVLLANAYIGEESYQLAREQLERAIAASRAEGSQPRENWLAMLAAVYYELGDLEAMRETTRELALVYPRKQYFLNLAALLGQLGDQERQLALVESLLEDGRLERAQQLQMAANLYLALDLPYKAATLLEKSMAAGALEADEANLEQLSQAWYSAAEVDRAIPPLERAAKLSSDGETYLRLARLHMDAYRFGEAAVSVRKAIAAGGLRQEGPAWLLYGMALARMDKWDAAAKALVRAADYQDTRRYATQWLAYVNSEQERAAALSGASGGAPG